MKLTEYNTLSKTISQLLIKSKIRPNNVVDNAFGHSVVWFGDEVDLNRAEKVLKKLGYKIYDKDVGFRNNRFTVKEQFDSYVRTFHKTNNTKSSLYKKIMSEFYDISEDTKKYGIVLKTMKVSDLDSGDKDVLFRGDIITIISSSGGYYIAESPLTGNAIKVSKRFVKIKS